MSRMNDKQSVAKSVDNVGGDMKIFYYHKNIVGNYESEIEVLLEATLMRMDAKSHKEGQ